MRKTTHPLFLTGLTLLLTSPTWAQGTPSPVPSPAPTTAPAPAATPVAEPATPATSAAPAEATVADPGPAAPGPVDSGSASASSSAAPVEPAAAEPVPLPVEAPAEPPPAEPTPRDAFVGLSADPRTADAAARKSAPTETTRDESGIPGWFRVDSDGLGLQLWFGAAHDLGDDIYLATDIYLDAGSRARFDVGIEIPVGDSLLLPMIGLGFDWSQLRPTYLIAPQLFAYIDGGPIYVEYWGQLFFGSPLASDDIDVSGATEKALAEDTFYNRLQLFFNVSDTVQVGPQIELTMALNDAAKGPDDDAIVSLPIGVGSNIGYGENNTLGLWLAYETDVDSQNIQTDMNNGDDIVRALTGRFTFVRTW